MSEIRVVGQMVFTLTKFSDGELQLCESGMRIDDAQGERMTYTAYHQLEGTCDPEEMSYTLWAAMEAHL